MNCNSTTTDNFDDTVSLGHFDEENFSYKKPETPDKRDKGQKINIELGWSVNIDMCLLSFFMKKKIMKNIICRTYTDTATKRINSF